MRVLVLNDHQRLSPRIECEIDTLAERYDVSVLCWDRSGTAEPDENSEYVTLPAPSGSLLLALYLPLLYLKLYGRISRTDCDVLHVTHIMFLPLAAVVGTATNVQVVYDVYERHAIEISYYFPASKHVRQLLEQFENVCVRATDLVLTVDTPDDMLADRYRSVQSHVEVLYNVPTVGTPTPNAELESRLADKEVLVYVGNISEAKGVRQMLRAFETVATHRPDAYLLLIGSYQDSQAPVEASIEAAGLEDRVEHVEWLPYDEMMTYLAVADIGLALHQPREKFRYVSTGTGRKFFTYMQAGLPIVGPEQYEIGEVVRDTGCGELVDTTDPDAIATAIEGLLADDGRRQELGERGRTAIETRYNWGHESETLLDQYERLARHTDR